MSGVEEYGHAMVGGHRLPVVGLHMCHGQISLRILVPQGFPGCSDANLTLFGHDDRGIIQALSTVDIPALTDEFALIDLELGLQP